MELVMAKSISPSLVREDSAICISEAKPHKALSYFDIPAELRHEILEYVFEDNLKFGGFTNNGLGDVLIDEAYSSASHLQPLLTCRQMYRDGCLLALNRTSFVVSNMFFNIPQRLSTLHPKQLEAIRAIAFVADNRHFRKLPEWGSHPFGISSLHLDSLTIVLHRSSHWHYLFDFTPDIVTLLRGLKGVKRLTIIRNAARVKGSLKTWYNRLVALILKVDHHERYEKSPPTPETTWWTWSYDEMAQSLTLEAQPAKPLVDEETYMQQVLPLMENLKTSIENEEWNPDPRSRNMYY